MSDARNSRSWTKLSLRDEVDSLWVAENGDQFEVLWNDPPDVIVVDLSAVTFLDSTGIGLVARCVRTCPEEMNSVYVLEPNDLVSRSLDAVGLLSLVTVVRNPHDYRSMYKVLSTFEERALLPGTHEPAQRAG